MVRGLIFAHLVVAGTAIQLAPGYAGAGAMCEEEKVPFEAPNQWTDSCVVYCVPAGECLGKAQMGILASYGITGEGNCRSHGYTESGQMTVKLKTTGSYLRKVAGPCRGMTLIPFQKPAGVREGAAPNDGRCKQDQKPYEAISQSSPGVCSVYCVPEGACELQAQTGQLGVFGITGEGNCRGKGYTEPASLGKMGQAQAEWLEYQQGACKGMTFAKFEQPSASEEPAAVDAAGGALPLKWVPEERSRGMAPGALSAPEAPEAPGAAATRGRRLPRMCGREMAPYEAHNPMSPDACGVFCVPAGECEGMVQEGKLSNLNIVGRGNCKSKGFTEVAPRATFTDNIRDSLKWSQGACRGMTYERFLRKPKPAGDDLAPVP